VKITQLLANDVEPVTHGEINRRLAAIGINVTRNGLESAIHRARGSLVNIRCGGYMLRSVYDGLGIKWFETRESIVEMAEEELRRLGRPASTKEILSAFHDRGMAIHGGHSRVFGKQMSISGRFVVVSEQPTFWAVKAARSQLDEVSTPLAA
jgi:hypothetical protein